MRCFTARFLHRVLKRNLLITVPKYNIVSHLRRNWHPFSKNIIQNYNNNKIYHPLFKSTFCTVDPNQDKNKDTDANNNDLNIKIYDFDFLDCIFQSQWVISPEMISKLKNEMIYDVLVLNASGSVLIKKLCNNANTIICADGGANSLFRSGITGLDITPNAIVGDLDSVEKHILDYFISNGTHKILMNDQNNSDFYKALNYLLNLNTLSSYIICWGAFGDRFDHEMQSFNTLRRFTTDPLADNKEIMLMTSDNFAIILKPGKYIIKCAKLQGPVCSLIPLFEKTKIKTKGLKYDINGQLEFGGLVSTSNGFIDKRNIEIETDNLIVFHTSCNIQVDYDTWAW